MLLLLTVSAPVEVLSVKQLDERGLWRVARLFDRSDEHVATVYEGRIYVNPKSKPWRQRNRNKKSKIAWQSILVHEQMHLNGEPEHVAYAVQLSAFEALGDPGDDFRMVVYKNGLAEWEKALDKRPWRR